MSIEIVDDPTCDHPKPAGDLCCGACEYLFEAEQNDVGLGERFTTAVRIANESGELRSEYLEVMAENLLADALRLWQATGHDELDFELALLKSVSPPGFNQDWVSTGHEVSFASYAEYLKSPEWAEQRSRAIRRAGGRCQGCDTSDNLEVHHRTYKDGWAFEQITDLTVLCASCHTAVHLVADGRRGKVRATSRRAR